MAVQRGFVDTLAGFNQSTSNIINILLAKRERDRLEALRLEGRQNVAADVRALQQFQQQKQAFSGQQVNIGQPQLGTLGQPGPSFAPTGPAFNPRPQFPQLQSQAGQQATIAGQLQQQFGDPFGVERARAGLFRAQAVGESVGDDVSQITHTIVDPNNPRSARLVRDSFDKKTGAFLNRVDVGKAVPAARVGGVDPSFGAPSATASKELTDLIGLSRVLDGFESEFGRPGSDLADVSGFAQNIGAAIGEFTGIKKETPFIGSIANFFGATTPNKKQIAFRQTVKDLADRVLRARSGAQINEQEFRRMMSFLPNLKLSDEANAGRIAGFNASLKEIIGIKQGALAETGKIPITGNPVSPADIQIAQRFGQFSSAQQEKVMEGWRRNLTGKQILDAVRSGKDLPVGNATPSLQSREELTPADLDNLTIEQLQGL
jgi:hypothetical protein